MILMQDIFAFKQTGIDDQRQALGHFHASGIRPDCLERLRSAGSALPAEMFEERILNCQ
jgi:pilus assembly protein CpaF